MISTSGWKLFADEYFRPEDVPVPVSFEDGETIEADELRDDVSQRREHCRGILGVRQLARPLGEEVGQAAVVDLDWVGRCRHVADAALVDSGGEPADRALPEPGRADDGVPLYSKLVVKHDRAVQVVADPVEDADIHEMPRGLIAGYALSDEAGPQPPGEGQETGERGLVALVEGPGGELRLHEEKRRPRVHHLRPRHGEHAHAVEAHPEARLAQDGGVPPYRGREDTCLGRVGLVRHPASWFWQHPDDFRGSTLRSPCMGDGVERRADEQSGVDMHEERGRGRRGREREGGVEERCRGGLTSSSPWARLISDDSTVT